MKIYEGIDLSKHNRVLSWNDVKHKNNVDFVILRAGGFYDGFYKDSKFERYYDACKNYDIPVGAYYDCGKIFVGNQTGIDYAKHFQNLLSGKQFEYPVFMDIEVTPAHLKRQITNAAFSFCEEMENAGFYVGIYASDVSGFTERLYYNELRRFDTWVAKYGGKPNYIHNPGLWQYTSKGSINGISGYVDKDKAYKNYESIIKGAKLNGY